MAKYTAIKEEAQKKYTVLHDRVGLFWAFSREQFDEGKRKHPIAEGEKYTNIGMGGYLPSKNVKEFSQGMADIAAWEKQAIKQAKSEEVILYELNNHECFYTGDIEDAMLVLGEHYTEEEVKAVYHKYRTADAIN